DVSATSSIRDLGVIIDGKLTFSKHCASVAKKASGVLHLLFRVFRCRSIEVHINAYVAYIRPILEYASPVCSPRLASDAHVIERYKHAFVLTTCCWSTTYMFCAYILHIICASILHLTVFES